MSSSRLDGADQRGDLTLGMTLLLLAFFILLMALHPPVRAQPIAAQAPNAPASDDAPDTGVSYFHLRAGMGSGKPLYIAIQEG